MPYTIKKIRNGLWVKINDETGKVKSHHTSKAKAEASIAAAHAHEGRLSLKTLLSNILID